MPTQADALGEDLQLALYVCYELHYRGFAGVDPDWEWSPALLGWRARLESAFLTALRSALPAVPALREQLAGLLTDAREGADPRSSCWSAVSAGR